MNMTQGKRLALPVCVIALCVSGSAGPVAAEQTRQSQRPNVLFIAVDDLRPALGCYGDATAITPNIDHLASRGTIFDRAYCQLAVCSPSRLSLLTGRRPDTIKVWDLGTHFRDAVPDVVTLPQHFKNNGYHTESLGKIFHGSGKPSKDPPSWSVPARFDVVRDPMLRYASRKNRQGTGLKRSASESADVPDNTYIDGVVCDAAVQTLSRLQEQQRPFFLAVGFRKPHLPFCAPQKYWRLYDRTSIPLPENDGYPIGAPELATRSWSELEGYSDIPQDGKISTSKVRELRHGYYACVSYVDALVGRLIDQLAALQLADNTVVVLWGDHGFHLGEQGLWTKANNYEWSTRVPLIVSIPGQEHAGETSDAIVELVDLYPTLTDVCQLETPVGLEGISFKPLVDDPDRAWKLAALSQYPRANAGSRHSGHGDIMGYAVRTDRFRYVEWRKWNSDDVLSRELYDHESDALESRNLATQAEYAAHTQELSEILSGGWQSVLPDAVNADDELGNVLDHTYGHHPISASQEDTNDD
tara:strand:+ start:413062 stop:414645 length:1584 start_codon:yes stop_codon:yes gene_type:complete